MTGLIPDLADAQPDVIEDQDLDDARTFTVRCRSAEELRAAVRRARDPYQGRHREGDAA